MKTLGATEANSSVEPNKLFPVIITVSEPNTSIQFLSKGIGRNIRCLVRRRRDDIFEERNR